MSFFRSEDMKAIHLLTILALISTSACLQSLNAANTLTDKQAADGWILLFDGKSLAGWRGYNGVDIEGAWVAEKGTLQLVSRPKGSPHANIITEQQFDDFDLRFDFKITDGANSGVMFNVGEGPKQPYLTGPEYQILDNLGFRTNKGEPATPEQYTASNYAIEPAYKEVMKPVGEWNKGRIVVKGNRVQYFLNGEKTMQYVMHSPEWKKQIAASKFSKWKDFCTLEKGHIGLQDHGHQVWFRNLKIKKL
jgi:hypothetical protein